MKDEIEKIYRAGRSELSDNEFRNHLDVLERRVNYKVGSPWIHYAPIVAYILVTIALAILAFDYLNNTTNPSQQLEPLPISTILQSRGKHGDEAKELFYLNYYLNHHEKAIYHFENMKLPSTLDSLYGGINYLMLDLNAKSYNLLKNLNFAHDPILQESHLYYLGVSAWYSDHRKEATSIFCRLNEQNSNYVKKFDPSYM